MSATEHIVVDIGNTRMKWGRVEGDRVVEKVALNYDNLESWQVAAREWNANPGQTVWTYAHVNSERAHQLHFWLVEQGFQARKLINTQLPLKIDVDFPDQVGIDRLLNALAVDRKPAIIVSAGSAITVDAVSKNGVFLGGSIFPGLRLMAEALHAHTAQLPRIDATPPAPALPARNTTDAIHAGIVLAAAGGIVGCFAEMISVLGESTTGYVTGGDGLGLRPYLPFHTVDAPRLTLQGILNAARALWP